MPTYEYECKDCKKKFTVILSIYEHVQRKEDQAEHLRLYDQDQPEKLRVSRFSGNP
jgi:hypothetical protein